MKAADILVLLALLASTPITRAHSASDDTSGTIDYASKPLALQTLQTILANRGYSSASNSASSELSAVTSGSEGFGFSVVSLGGSIVGRKLLVVAPSKPTNAQVSTIGDFIGAILAQAGTYGCTVPRRAVTAKGFRNLGDGSMVWDIIIDTELAQEAAHDDCLRFIENLFTNGSPGFATPHVVLHSTNKLGYLFDKSDFPAENATPSEIFAQLKESLQTFTSTCFNWGTTDPTTLYYYFNVVVGISVVPVP